MKFSGWKERCQQLEAENRQLRRRLAQLQEKVGTLQSENARLTQALAAAKKNSSNSSKPPSSDIVKPPKRNSSRGRSRKRKIGGQKGHPKHEWTPFAPDQVTEFIAHRLKRCPINPAHRIIPADHRQSTLQQIELVENPFRVTEHVTYGIWCEDCHCYHDAPWPVEVRAAGLFGPRISALTVYLKGRLHGSHSAIRDFLQDVVGVRVSRGYVAKVLAKSAKVFQSPFQELFDLLPRQTKLNVDETGHREMARRYWTWCFRARAFVLFKIEPSRATEVLLRILGPSFQGILGCDYYAAYRKYARQCHVLVQFCLAHLIRDVKYLCEFPDEQVQAYGQGLLEGLKALFGSLHRKDRLSPTELERQLQGAKKQICQAALQPLGGGDNQPHRLIGNMARRFRKHGEGYFEFITHPQVDPTNNSGEQAMRFVVMDRYITQGTRSLRGRQICERLWTVMGTCAIQKRSAFQWMCAAFSAYFHGKKPPSLRLDSS